MKNLKEVFEKIKGKQITSVTSGGSNASTIIITFGKDEFCLFVYCVWRLDQKNKVLAGWNDPSGARKGNLTLQTKELRNDFVKEISASNMFDLKLEFKSGKNLNIFCDITPMFQVKDYDINWSIIDFTKNKALNVTRSFEVKVEKFNLI